MGKEGDPRIISTAADLAGLRGDVPVVHFSRQHLINVGNVVDLLKRCRPGAVQVAPSRKQLIGPQIRSALEQRGVVLQFGRARDRSQYDRTIPSDYAAKRELFEKMLADPSRASQFENMLKHGLWEARIGEAYFRRDGFVPVWQLARQFELQSRNVQERLACFCAWLGWPYKDKNVLEARRGLNHRLEILERRSAVQEVREKLMGSFAVDEEFPPDTLPVERWKAWQAVRRAVKNYPDALAALKQSEPYAAGILVDYVRLEGWDGVTNRFHQIAEKFKVSGQTIRNQVAKALKVLGQY